MNDELDSKLDRTGGTSEEGERAPVSDERQELLRQEHELLHALEEVKAKLKQVNPPENQEVFTKTLTVEKVTDRVGSKTIITKEMDFAVLKTYLAEHGLSDIQEGDTIILTSKTGDESNGDITLDHLMGRHIGEDFNLNKPE